MGIIAWIIFGFFAGLIARAVLPGDQKLGFIRTTLLGVGGSFVGGAIASLASGFPIGSLQSVGFIGSVLGAILLLVVGGMISKRR